MLPTVLLLGLLLIHLSYGLRIPRVPNPDEQWTLNILLDNVNKLIWSTILKRDNHPPLYYILSKGWIELTGATIAGLRWLSFLFTGITLCFIAWVYRRRPRLEMAVVLLLIGTNPLLTYFSATVRPYSMVVLLATLMTFSAAELRGRHSIKADHSGEASDCLVTTEIDSRRASSGGQRNWYFLYYGSALLLGLTHYFGTLYVLLATCLDLISRRIERSPWNGMFLLLLIFFWPVLQVLTGSLDDQASHNSWVNVFPLISTINNFLAGVFPLLIISRTPQLGFGLVLALVLLLIALRPVLKGAGKLPIARRGWVAWLLANDSAFLVVLVTAVVAAGCVADALLPFTTPYYFLVCLPAVMILLGRLISASNRDLFSGSLSVFLILAIVALQIQLAHQRLSLP
jgi:uncharacterized membrane protein